MSVSAAIPIGASGLRTVVVTRELTVAHFHPEMPEVYGTPMMIYLMELAASDAIQSYLPPGWASVGAVVNVQHLTATPVGLTVTARARVVQVNGRMISFAVEAHDGVEKIGEGTHVRGLIDLARFHSKVSQKNKQQ
ncbi:MAG TPA: thioesterase family protein [Candidatus Angelobacter sp.]|jgi:predicted thioesterase|nr:thioesterase family protein [Candidatus Angelobacter sp.]